jgi:hypothetical protein
VKQRLGHGAGARAAKCAATEVARASQRDARANRVAMRARARDASDASDEDDASTSDAPRARASGRRALDYVRFDDGNAHGRAFERSALRRTMARDTAFDSMARHRKVKKEITEAHGALAQVRRALRAGGGGGKTAAATATAWFWSSCARDGDSCRSCSRMRFRRREYT